MEIPECNFERWLDNLAEMWSYNRKVLFSGDILERLKAFTSFVEFYEMERIVAELVDAPTALYETELKAKHTADQKHFDQALKYMAKARERLSKLSYQDPSIAWSCCSKLDEVIEYVSLDKKKDIKSNAKRKIFYFSPGEDQDFARFGSEELERIPGIRIRNLDDRQTEEERAEVMAYAAARAAVQAIHRIKPLKRGNRDYDHAAYYLALSLAGVKKAENIATDLNTMLQRCE